MADAAPLPLATAWVTSAAESERLVVAGFSVKERSGWGRPPDLLDLAVGNCDMADKKQARLLLGAPLVASGLMLAGCLGSPTYGTDKTASAQLARRCDRHTVDRPEETGADRLQAASRTREAGLDRGFARAAGARDGRLQPGMASNRRSSAARIPRRSDGKSGQSDLRLAGHSRCGDGSHAAAVGFGMRGPADSGVNDSISRPESKQRAKLTSASDRDPSKAATPTANI